VLCALLCDPLPRQHVRRPPFARARRWCFTINNPTVDETDGVKKLVKLDTVRMMCVGRETAPTTGTVHLQGFIGFTVAMLLSTLKTIGNACLARAHFEAAKGSPASNQQYCSKGGDVIATKGFFKKQDRGGIAYELLTDIHKGATFTELMRKPEFAGSVLRYTGNIQRIIDLRIVDAWRNFTRGSAVIFIHGPTNLGKTFWAHKNFGNRMNIVPLQRQEKSGAWFGKYGPQPVLLWDEFRAGSTPVTNFTRTVDGYPCEAEFKGGHQFLTHCVTVLTSNYQLEECFPDADVNTWDAIKRRITHNITAISRQQMQDLEVPMDIIQLIDNWYATRPDKAHLPAGWKEAGEAAAAEAAAAAAPEDGGGGGSGGGGGGPAGLDEEDEEVISLIPQSPLPMSPELPSDMLVPESPVRARGVVAAVRHLQRQGQIDTEHMFRGLAAGRAIAWETEEELDDDDDIEDDELTPTPPRWALRWDPPPPQPQNSSDARSYMDNEAKEDADKENAVIIISDGEDADHEE